MDNGAETLLGAAAVDGQDSEAGCNAPDLVKGYHCELTAPVESNTYSTQTCHKFVTAVLATVETPIAVLPDAFNAMDTVWLAKNILKCDLL